MIQGKTESGFVFQLEEDALDDMELLDTLAEMQENLLKIGTAVQMLLGEEQKKRLYDHLRNEKGRVRAEPLSKELLEIIQAAGKPGKKS